MTIVGAGNVRMVNTAVKTDRILTYIAPHIKNNYHFLTCIAQIYTNVFYCCHQICSDILIEQILIHQHTCFLFIFLIDPSLLTVILFS